MIKSSADHDLPLAIKGDAADPALVARELDRFLLTDLPAVDPVVLGAVEHMLAGRVKAAGDERAAMLELPGDVGAGGSCGHGEC